MKILIFSLLAVFFTGLAVYEGDQGPRNESRASDSKPDGAPDESAAGVSPAKQAAANKYVGFTEPDLIEQLGTPLSSEVHNVDDGSFKMLQFDDTKDHETFFVIWADEGKVRGGCYKGTPTNLR